MFTMQGGVFRSVQAPAREHQITKVGAGKRIAAPVSKKFLGSPSRLFIYLGSIRGVGWEGGRGRRERGLGPVAIGRPLPSLPTTSTPTLGNHVRSLLAKKVRSQCTTPLSFNYQINTLPLTSSCPRHSIMHLVASVPSAGLWPSSADDPSFSKRERENNCAIVSRVFPNDWLSKECFISPLKFNYFCRVCFGFPFRSWVVFD